MSNKFTWDDEESFLDIPEEVQLSNGVPMQSEIPQVTIQRRPENDRPMQVKSVEKAIPKEYSHDEKEMAYDADEEDFTAILSDASLRLEQGNLYKMIMNHDLFQGMEADSRAIKNVQKEIRKFAKERMEVMLGMRQTVEASSPLYSLPFNELEVTILKRLASAASKGATESPEAESQTWAPKRETLNPITFSAGNTRPKTLAGPSAPISRPKKEKPPAEAEYEPLRKHPSELSEDELIERHRQTMERQKGKLVKSSDAKPMATYDQTLQLAQQQVESSIRAPGLSRVLDILSKANQHKQ